MLRRQWLPAVVLVVGSLITVLAASTVNGFILRAETSNAAIAADRATAAVRLALDRAAIATRALRAMYAADSVTNEQFVRFSQTLATSQYMELDAPPGVPYAKYADLLTSSLKTLKRLRLK